MKKLLSLLLSAIIFISCFSVLSVNSFALTYEEESNGTEYYATNINLNESVIGNLSHEDDEDYYKFTITQPGKIRLYFEHPYVEYCWEDETYWKILISKKDSGTVITQHITGDSYEGDYTSYIGVDAGTYYIYISSYYDGWVTTYHSEVDYTLLVDYVASINCENEPNNNYYTGGREISLKTTYYGNQPYSPYSWTGGYEDTEDWFKIEIPYTGMYTLNCDSDATISMKDAEGYDAGSVEFSRYKKSENILLNKGVLYIGVKDGAEYSFNITPYLAAPPLKSATRITSGVKVTWETVPGASQYIIYRKTNNTNWTRLSVVLGTSFVDETVTPGIAYIYTVKAQNKYVTGSYNKNGIKFVPIAAPKFTKIQNVNNTVKVTWGKVTYADGYYLYRKASGETSWKRIATLKGNATVNYTDKNVSNNKAYAYIVRAYGDGDVSVNSATTKILHLNNPKLTKIENASSGVKVTWGKVAGATNYVVYRRTYNASTKKWSSWVNIAKGVKTNSYVDKTAKSGTYYIYTVKALAGAYTSGYNATGLKTYFLARPKISKVENINKAVKITWTKITGAEGYYVYRKGPGETAWKKIATVKGNTYKDTNVSNNKVYTYSVKAYYGTRTSYLASSLKFVYLAAPTLTKVTSTTSGIKFTWGKVSGAEGYHIYRKTTSGSFKKIATVYDTGSYIDASAKKGTTYYYTVKAFKGSRTSAYNTTGLKVKDIY